MQAGEREVIIVWLGQLLDDVYYWDEVRVGWYIQHDWVGLRWKLDSKSGMVSF